MAAPAKGYRVTRTWEGRIAAQSQTQREPSISVSIDVCATCVVLFVPSVAHLQEIDIEPDPTTPWKKTPWSCDRCGLGAGQRGPR